MLTDRDKAAYRLFEQPFSDLDPTQRAIVDSTLTVDDNAPLLDRLLHRIATD